MSDRQSALEFATEIAHLGGDIAMKHYQKGPAMSRKKDGTWVTEADLAVEAELRAQIAKAWPQHNILGEEQGHTSSSGGAPTPGPTWILDPIDGTHNYMAGIPVWATLVGLRTEEGYVVGVCHAPALGETYEAAVGSGARMNGRTITAADVDTLDEATTLFGDPQGFIDDGLGQFLEELVGSSWRIRGFGDFWGHMLVARGAAHVMVEPELSLWDVAALIPIIEEAGARISHLDGTTWSGRGSCLTACASLHPHIVGMAQDVASAG